MMCLIFQICNIFKPVLEFLRKWKKSKLGISASVQLSQATENTNLDLANFALSKCRK